MKRLKVNGEELKVQISPSFLQNAACPAYLRFRYIEKPDDTFIRIAAERGKTAHAAIAEVLTYCLDSKTPLAEVENDLLREALQRHLPVSIMSETALIYSWLQLWRDRYQIPKHIYGVENKVALDDEYEECDWKDASYRGIVDVGEVSGSHARITDWKSQPHILSQSELDEFEQGTVYCFLFQKMYPQLKTFTFRLWYLRYGFYMETTRSEEQLQAFEDALMIRERKIVEIDNWNPIPGKHCQYCEYIHRCPIAQDLSPVNINIITQSQAEVAAQRVVVMEAFTKELKARLRDYVKKNDEIVINSQGFRYGFKHSVSTVFPMKKVEDVLAEYDRQPSEVTKNANVKMVKKLIKTTAKDDPGLSHALEETAEEKNKTEFKGYTPKKPGDDDDDGDDELE